MKRKFRAFPKGDHSEFFELNEYDLPRCTPRQRSYIYGLLDRAQMSDDELIDEINPLCDSIKDFSPKDASKAIEYLKSLT